VSGPPPEPSCGPTIVPADTSGKLKKKPHFYITKKCFISAPRMQGIFRSFWSNLEIKIV